MRHPRTVFDMPPHDHSAAQWELSDSAVGLREPITLVRPSTLPKAIQPCSNLSVTCMHRDIREVPADEVWIGGHPGKCLLLVVLVPELLVLLLVG